MTVYKQASQVEEFEKEESQRQKQDAAKEQTKKAAVRPDLRVAAGSYPPRPYSHSWLQAHNGVKDGRIKTKLPRSNIPPTSLRKLVSNESRALN
jgi:hypothetical protein